MRKADRCRGSLDLVDLTGKEGAREGMSLESQEGASGTVRVEWGLIQNEA